MRMRTLVFVKDDEINHSSDDAVTQENPPERIEILQKTGHQCGAEDAARGALFKNPEDLKVACPEGLPSSFATAKTGPNPNPSRADPTRVCVLFFPRRRIDFSGEMPRSRHSWNVCSPEVSAFSP